MGNPLLARDQRRCWWWRRTLLTSLTVKSSALLSSSWWCTLSRSTKASKKHKITQSNPQLSTAGLSRNPTNLFEMTCRLRTETDLLDARRLMTARQPVHLEQSHSPNTSLFSLLVSRLLRCSRLSENWVEMTTPHTFIMM